METPEGRAQLKPTPNLIRFNTETPWHELHSDMEMMEEDMTKQLNYLIDHNA